VLLARDRIDGGRQFTGSDTQAEVDTDLARLRHGKLYRRGHCQPILERLGLRNKPVAPGSAPALRATIRSIDLAMVLCKSA
jgi:hypothetical protein